MSALDDYFRPDQRVDLIKMDIKDLSFILCEGLLVF